MYAFAYIVCGNGDVRLVGGTSSSMEGRVEVCNNNVWGTVCDDLWDLSDGNVVCRQLGFGNASQALGNGFFGQGTGPIHLDNLQCTGNEASLFDCLHNGIGIEDCSHFEDAGVICAGIASLYNAYNMIMCALFVHKIYSVHRVYNIS